MYKQIFVLVDVTDVLYASYPMEWFSKKVMASDQTLCRKGEPYEDSMAGVTNLSGFIYPRCCGRQLAAVERP